MKTTSVVKISIIATTAMTLYSKILSGIKEENYSEPDMLSKLLLRGTDCGKAEAKLIAWTAHYGVGALFVAVYYHLWSHGGIERTVKNGLLVGALSGLVAMAVWKTVISLHPNPPHRNFTRYYLQLLPAHIVFGLCAFVARANVLGKGIGMNKALKKAESIFNI